MATTTKVVTLDDINNLNPTLRLRLREEAETLSTKRPAQRGALEKAKNYVENLFSNVQEAETLDTQPTEEARAKNKEKVKKIFQRMKEKIDKQEKEVLNEIDRLSPTQQEDVITFWEACAAFIDKVFQWLKSMFDYVLEKIRQGFRIIKETIKAVFNAVCEFFKIIF